MTALLERLGLPTDCRALIVSADGLGVSHSANAGVFASLRLGAATAAGLQMPCPWARHAASRVLPSDDVGVQLTLNAPFELYRWGPLTHAPTLLDGDGGFPRTVGDLWDHADVEEVQRECRAQLERARQWGVDVTHLSSYLGSLVLRPEFFDVFVDLAAEYCLPVRLTTDAGERMAGFPLRELVEAEGIEHPDHVVFPRSRPQLANVLAELPAGVTEVVLHPALDAPELRAYAPDWPADVEDHQLLVDDAHSSMLLREVVRIGYRHLRRSQRERHAQAPAPDVG